MRYLVKTTAGYTFVFRNVLEFKYTASEANLSVQLEGRKVNINGVTEIEAGGDFEPWAASFNMIPPKTDGESVEAEEEAPVGDEETDTGYEFPREPSVPIELATTTFAPLEMLSFATKKKDIQILFDAKTVVADGEVVNTREMTGNQLKDLVSSSRLITYDGNVFKSSTGENSKDFASGGLVGRSRLTPEILNTEYVFPARLGADELTVKRVEKAIRVNSSFAAETIRAMKDAHRRRVIN